MTEGEAKKKMCPFFMIIAAPDRKNCIASDV